MNEVSLWSWVCSVRLLSGARPIPRLSELSLQSEWTVLGAGAAVPSVELPRTCWKDLGARRTTEAARRSGNCAVQRRTPRCLLVSEPDPGNLDKTQKDQPGATIA